MTDLVLWLCPHKVVNFEEAWQMLLYKPPDAEDFYTEGVFHCNPACFRALNSVIRHRFGEGRFHELTLKNSIIEHRLRRRHELLLNTQITLLSVTNPDDPFVSFRQYFTTNRIVSALAHMDFRLCSHLRTSDGFVYKHFTRSCTRHKSLSGSMEVCSCPEGYGRNPYDNHYRSCQQCRQITSNATFFAFNTVEVMENGVKKLDLYLDVFRHLGPFDDPADPAWRHHAVDAAQAGSLSRQWQHWLEYRSKKVAGWEKRTTTPNLEDGAAHESPIGSPSLYDKCLSVLRDFFGRRVTIKQPAIKSH